MTHNRCNPATCDLAAMPADDAFDSTDDALLAEVESLHEQLRHLTASGHELISTQTRMQSLPQPATDAIIPFEADGSVSSFNSAAELIFDVAEIEVLHQAASQLFDLPERFHDNVPGFLLDNIGRFPDRPAAERELIFARFRQSTRNDRANAGIGLGLAIAREVVRGHGGTISAQHSRDAASSFQVRVPRRPQ